MTSINGEAAIRQDADGRNERIAGIDECPGK